MAERAQTKSGNSAIDTVG